MWKLCSIKLVDVQLMILMKLTHTAAKLQLKKKIILMLTTSLASCTKEDMESRKNLKLQSFTTQKQPVMTVLKPF